MTITIYRDILANSVVIEDSVGVQFLNNLTATDVGSGNVTVTDNARAIQIITAMPFSEFIDKDLNAYGIDAPSTVIALNEVFAALVLFYEANPTGLVDGGEVNIGPGVNDVEILSGIGVIIDSYTDPDARPASVVLDWPQINEAITAAPSAEGSIVYLTIYNTGVPSTPIDNVPVFVGALRQYDTYPTPSVIRDELFLGVTLYVGGVWKDVSFPKVLNNTAESLYDIMNTVTGPMFIIDGGQVTEAASYTLDQAEGTIWQYNRNWQNDHKDPHREAIPQTTGIEWRYTNRDFTDVGSLTDTVDDDTWDNNGTVEAVPGSGNAATIQRLYVDVDGNFWGLWGQQIYDNAQEAASRINAPIVVPPLLAASFLLGYIVTEKGQTDWDEDEAFFLQGGSAGTGAPSVPITNHNDLLNRDIADTHPINAIEDMSLVVAPYAVGDGIVWTGAGWEALKLWVAAGYGGILQSAPTALANIGAGWVTLVADATAVSTPRGVVQSTTNNSLEFDTAGVWRISVGVSLSHNESNGSRTFDVRLFDITSATGGNSTTIGVGRNTDTSTWSTSFLVDISPGEVGDEWRVEVGGTSDTISSVVENSFIFSANLVSEYRG